MTKGRGESPADRVGHCRVKKRGRAGEKKNICRWGGNYLEQGRGGKDVHDPSSRLNSPSWVERRMDTQGRKRDLLLPLSWKKRGSDGAEAADFRWDLSKVLGDVERLLRLGSGRNTDLGDAKGQWVGEREASSVAKKKRLEEKRG